VTKNRKFKPRLLWLVLAPFALLLAGAGKAPAPLEDPEQTAQAIAAARANRALLRQTPEGELAKSRGCLTCHVGIEPMHASAAVKLGCTDCHGGDPVATTKEAAHVASPTGFGRPGDPAATPERSYSEWLRQPADFVRFVNPGDLRVAQEACGGCHQEQVGAMLKSPMRTTAIFWAAVGYANGILPSKRGVFGEAYGRDGTPQGLRDSPPDYLKQKAGALDFLLPLPRWQVVAPGEYFRAFEKGGALQPAIFPEIGNPNPKEDAGRPDIRLSDRDRGTGLRISPGLINLHKTRLNDPHLSLPGTSDHPGDFRASGCAGCHLVYANDRDPKHSGPWASAGHLGIGASGDAAIKKGPGHPIRHQLTRAVPTSQCMSCHMHQPNSFVNTYLGYTMWDYESDGELFWPKEEKKPTLEEARASLDRNPEGAAVRGLWTDPELLAKVAEKNGEAKHTQFADYHGHGWIFQAVFSRDRKGNLLDGNSQVVPFDDPGRFQKAVHLRDIHLEKGMHCADCHFSQDVHGTGAIHAEYGDAIEIECQDCHGDVGRLATLRTSGPAAPPGGTDLSRGMTSYGESRFVWRDSRLFQRSSVEKGLEWPVPQVKNVIDPLDPDYNAKAEKAKKVCIGGGTEGELAHSSQKMTCTSCHSAWITSCFGCHLPQEANQKSASLRYEGDETRNYASYNPQVVRSDVYMLGKSGPNKGGKWTPVRSSSALLLSSTNLNRQRFYVQQPPISTPGFSSQAFNPHVPHTVRLNETKACADCHLTEAEDNNAWMAQLLLQGTGQVNFLGHQVWLGLGEEGIEAVKVTEWDEPQAVIGSYLHSLAYPQRFADHQARDLELPEASHHHGAGEVLSLQHRGEYLFAALGKGGFRAFDVANVANKDFSEKIVTAPVSPWGQDTAVATRDAVEVLLPSNQPMAFADSEGQPRPADPTEQAIHPLFRYALVADREEGLILVDTATLTDGDPRNNFLERAVTFDGGGKLRGARSLALAGTMLYVGTESGLEVVDLSRPLEPRLVASLPEAKGLKSLAVQFRFLFGIDEGGLAVFEITDPRQPAPVARLAIEDARKLYLARTWAYVAAGRKGLAIVDIERPKEPRLDQVFDGGGKLHEVNDVKVGMTNTSSFAYLADGKAGLAVVQLTSPPSVPGYLGFSPRPAPRLIAHRHTEGPALALSRGLDRDRAVDESGNQIAVMNRIGARPPSLEDMQRLYLRQGRVYRVDGGTGEKK
jgi:hypothetical protein